MPSYNKPPGEGMDSKPAASPMPDAGNEHGSMSTDEHCIPLDALAMPGEDEMMNQPAQGDPVTYTVEGKVSRIEGGNAYVKVETVNGKPMTDEASKTNNTPDDQSGAELSQLREMAGQMGGM